jgi:hypothetical protein
MVDETLQHVLLDFAFAREYWLLLGMQILSDNGPFRALENNFCCTLALTCWSIWTTRCEHG